MKSVQDEKEEKKEKFNSNRQKNIFYKEKI